MSEASEAHGNGLIIGAYGDQASAHRVFEALTLADPDDGSITGMAALVRKDSDGAIHYKETGDTKTGEGVGLGGLGGAFLGLLAGPGGAAIGAAAGALLGGLGAMKDAGFDDESLKTIGGALPPGAGAVIATTSSEAVARIREATPPGLLLSQARDIASNIQQRLAAGDDVLMTMVIADDGVSVMEVLASPAELTVFGFTAVDGVIAAAGASAVIDTDDEV